LLNEGVCFTLAGLEARLPQNGILK